ncbi:MAG TPA: phosphatidylserine decarboxylase family protein, partial [Syntrophaceae bacterium]|nr:phosphatidylserine decarboxylase family protein [Syntrophaceae bacterium]
MKVYIPIAKEGYPFIFLGGVLSLIAWLWGKAISIVPFSIVLFLIYFFRDPERITPVENKGIISPADGKVISVDEHFENRFLKEKVVKISIFMSLWDVHINRIPLDGKISDIFYKTGKFFAAFTNKASNLNEHNAIILKTKNNRYILL